MNHHTPVALIAEDEHVLARGLVKTLGKLWPALQICAVTHDGEAATEAARQHLPDVVFLDIQMPECNGLDAAERMVDNWPAERALPLIVFVTAFDRFAISAFEREAVDYVLKPVQADRMAVTCQRLQQRLLERGTTGDEAALAPIQALRRPAPPREPPLSLIQAGVGSTLHMVPVSDVMYFEADDKYVRVVTQAREHLIRTPLRELTPRLDASQFMQIHRGTLVRADCIERVVREDTGRISLYMRGRPERLAVSRSYAHLFKAM